MWTGLHCRPQQPLRLSANECAPILWIRILPYDPNIKLRVVNPTTMAVIKEGRGSDPMPLFRRDYGLGWAGNPLLLEVKSESGALHTYSLSLRLSIPIASFCCCWNTIVLQDFGTLGPDRDSYSFDRPLRLRTSADYARWLTCLNRTPKANL